MIYQIDAVTGPLVKTGEIVEKGRIIGKNDDDEDVLSGIDGIVSFVGFCGETHSFRVIIEER